MLPDYEYCRVEFKSAGLELSEEVYEKLNQILQEQLERYKK